MAETFEIVRDLVNCMTGLQMKYISGSDDQIIDAILGKHRDVMRSAVSDRMIIKAFHGIHPFHLDQLSHEIALHIEQMRSAVEAEKYPLEIIRRYCELARENAYPDLKPFTRLAVTYFKEHLSDNLTVKGTAQALLVNANYPSHQFHRDMGITFVDFVNRERINQAAALLKHTNLQIQQIAATVGYNNTSYFARQFVKFHRMTPRAYRNSGML